MKEIFTWLYDVSSGAWIMSLFITCNYDNPTPMWIAFFTMTIFNILRFCSK